MCSVSDTHVRSDGVPALARHRSASPTGTDAVGSVGAPALGREHLLGILASVNEGVITADQTQTIVMANPAAAAMFGADDLVGMPLERLVPDRFRAPHRADLEAFGANGSGLRPMGHRPGVLGLRLDGREFPIEATISHTVVDGRRLFTVVLRDLTALREAQDELRASHAALQRLVAVQDRVQEEERKRIARELHDDLAQTLAMISITLSLAGRALGDDPVRAASLLADATKLTTDTVTSARRIINDLRPQALEALGLVQALVVLADEFSRRHGIPCDMEADEEVGDCAELTPEVATCLYRVAQEALTNVAKHAGAAHGHVRLSAAGQGRVALRVIDDGSGILPADRTKSGSFGLLGMHERVRAVGGDIAIASTPGAGTTITITVPGGPLPAAA
jgi:PAS domain S-box-containing protein